MPMKRKTAWIAGGIVLAWALWPGPDLPPEPPPRVRPTTFRSANWEVREGASAPAAATEALPLPSGLDGVEIAVSR